MKTIKEKAVAKHDHMTGCPCGLYRECEPNCEHHPNNKKEPALSKGKQIALLTSENNFLKEKIAQLSIADCFEVSNSNYETSEFNSLEEALACVADNTNMNTIGIISHKHLLHVSYHVYIDNAWKNFPSHQDAQEALKTRDELKAIRQEWKIVRTSNHAIETMSDHVLAENLNQHEAEKMLKGLREGVSTHDTYWYNMMEQEKPVYKYVHPCDGDK